ncbi:hypothetical protein EDC14_104817 [Hydrogenispora ethanolica]|uniref:Trypsin-like peptidase n=1 Tax=Hydrogenispora ethanolica TaxID=1082276 RepID=A0A4R1QXP5_HYDET|nr:hypothetical protein [Hydrogenispora ethanolica]TCL56804.1 hypothetical protein EDC14_104817 [Hydrogenispora ethanolica]
MRLFFEWEQALLLSILEEHQRTLTAFFENLTYLDIGYRFQSGKPLPELAIRIHVRRKLAIAELLPFQILPRKIAGFSVDVLQSNPVLQRAAAERDRRFDPIPGGVAVANPRLKGLGTLGTVVFDRSTPTPMGISAHHVLVGETGQTGDEIVQPAESDSSATVGNLLRWNKELDCAIFRFNHSRSVSRAILGIPQFPRYCKEPLVGMAVAKSGRTTGVTYGIIDGVNADGFTIIPDPSHPAPDGEISLPGDSGAIWLEPSSGAAVGLHVAGESDPDPTAERAWAKRINKVLNALDVSL